MDDQARSPAAERLRRRNNVMRAIVIMTAAYKGGAEIRQRQLPIPRGTFVLLSLPVPRQAGAALLPPLSCRRAQRETVARSRSKPIERS